MAGGQAAELIADAIVCCQFGRVARLRGLIEHKSVLSNAADKDGCTLLHWAAINGHAKITEYLLTQGKDLRGYRSAGNHRSLELEKRCQTNGWDTQVLTRITRVAFSMRSRFSGLPEKVGRAQPLQRSTLLSREELLRDRKAPRHEDSYQRGVALEHVNVQGRTVLHTAVLQQRRNVLLFLLAYGADPFATDQDDLTPLSWCCRYRPGALQIIQILARFSRRRINYQDRHLRNTALHWAVQCSNAQASTPVSSPQNDVDLSLSASRGTRRQMVTRASLMSGAEAVKVLLANKADAGIMNSFGHKPMTVALHWENRRVANVLQDYEREKSHRCTSMSIPPLAMLFGLSAVGVLGLFYGSLVGIAIEGALLLAHGRFTPKLLNSVGQSAAMTSVAFLELIHLTFTAQQSNVLENAIQFGLIAMTITLWYTCHCSTSQILSASDEYLKRVVLRVSSGARDDQDAAMNQICSNCLAPQLSTTWHCACCNGCVDRHVKHCYYIGTCIGRENHFTYVSFLFTALVFLVWNAYLQQRAYVEGALDYGPPLLFALFFTSILILFILKEIVLQIVHIGCREPPLKSRGLMRRNRASIDVSPVNPFNGDGRDLEYGIDYQGHHLSRPARTCCQKVCTCAQNLNEFALGHDSDDDGEF